MASLHCRIRTRIQTLNPMAKLHYAEVFTLLGSQIQIPILVAHWGRTCVGTGPGPEWVTVYYVKPSHWNLCGNLNGSNILALYKSRSRSHSHISSVWMSHNCQLQELDRNLGPSPSPLHEVQVGVQIKRLTTLNFPLGTAGKRKDPSVSDGTKQLISLSPSRSWKPGRSLLSQWITSCVVQIEQCETRRPFSQKPTTCLPIDV